MDSVIPLATSATSRITLTVIAYEFNYALNNSESSFCYEKSIETLITILNCIYNDLVFFFYHFFYPFFGGLCHEIIIGFC